ncbi:hypothetical protein DESC_610021 [Desulfosarcina cetonica]|nr:hypothetical protein DESC_610021 [Desulfosarcina cetonica]
MWSASIFAIKKEKANEKVRNTVRFFGSDAYDGFTGHGQGLRLGHQQRPGHGPRDESRPDRQRRRQGR